MFLIQDRSDILQDAGDHGLGRETRYRTVWCAAPDHTIINFI